MEEQYAIAFDAILEELKNRGNNRSEQGTIFEDFCKMILEKAPFFTDDVNEVWTWKEFPGNAGMHDTGVDLVVLDKQGTYWAVQCKFYSRDSKVSKASIDSFISASNRSFIIDGKTYNYSRRLVFSTTDDISENASGLFTTIGPDTIRDCGIDWGNFSFDDIEKVSIFSKKTPKEHQKKAIEDVMKGFETNDRGRLVMACGTGKTFTSLEIVESLYKKFSADAKNDFKNFNVLYLVPSIALLSQTIVEWKTQQTFGTHVRTFGVCSDQTAGQTKRNRKDADEILVKMPIPATTDVNRIQKEYTSKKCRVNIFFSTYQSIDVISNLAKACNITFDIAVCDEAHRTIGSYKASGEDLSNFVKIHKDSFAPCKKRLYMTATQKIYSTSAKQDAKDGGYEVYSMDDESIYGPLFHYLSFGEAVSKGLLTDYRLVVLTIRKKDVVKLKLPQTAFANLDDASRIVGSLSALSKIPSELNPDEFKLDPKPMKRAVAFCSTIAQAKSIAESYNHLKDDSCLGKDYMEGQNFVIPMAKLITGQDNTKEKNKMLDWLRGIGKDEIEDGTCHILTNARCLSEGVDVPSLDSVIFMAKKRSQVDIIQAVGRVMRKFGSGNKKIYGYIIIPVVINDEKLTDATLSNNEDYKVVWQVVQALRSHDERLDTQINKIGVTGKMPDCICCIDTFIPPVAKSRAIVGSLKAEAKEDFDSDDPSIADKMFQDFKVSLPSEDELRSNEKLFSARLVKNCGNRLYWEDWSKNIGDVTNNIALKIEQQISADSKVQNAFNKFTKNFKALLNPGISDKDCVNMLSEHIVTLPVLKAIFNENNMIDLNPVTQIMESMVKKLKGLESEIKALEPFYDSVRKTVAGVTSKEGRQEIIRKLFEKFFKYALPSSAEKFGIVYTPIEIVDFIINSVSDVLKNEFNESIANKGVKILDPFTGTGTFIVRVLDKLKSLGISDEDFTYKYDNDIWCNEIMLLAYYTSLINIEDTYGKAIGSFLPFSHDVLTDTFELEEKKNKNYQGVLFEEEDFKKANEKATEEQQQDIRIIIANPPYSAGQKNANNNNAKSEYKALDERISKTYLPQGKVNISSLYDSYVRAFRWASDRIGDNGVISFVSNGSYVDNLAFSGFRRELLKEFNHVYVFNLRGNQRTQGELSRKEGGKVFGSGSRNTICIITLVKHKGKSFDGFVHYKDIGDYLSREEKLKILKESESISNLEWENIYPDKKNDWINQTSEDFESQLLLGNKKIGGEAVFSSCYSTGIKTGKDDWQYNFSATKLIKSNENYLKKYNEEVQKWIDSKHVRNESVFKDFVDKDPKLIKWSNALFIKGNKGLIIKDNKDYRIAVYRPFVKKWVAYNPPLFYDLVKWPNILPIKDIDNIIISIPGISEKKEFSCLISKEITDLHFIGAAQCFPLYWYEKKDKENMLLFQDGEDMGNGYIRKPSISDEIIDKFRRKYSDDKITDRNIFNYIYALFHSKDYIKKYANNLAKEMPRIPFLKDFWGWSNIGKALIDLHLNYEKAKPYAGVKIEKNTEDYKVTKIRYLLKDRKDTIIFNDHIIISNIPLKAYDYVVNGRSPIDWVLDQYQYTVDKESGIIDDPNTYDEVKGGKYAFDLILSLITVSLETQKLIKELPEYKEI